jgi:hypothetical protein
MQGSTRRHFTGTYRGEGLGKGAWRLVSSALPPVEIFLRGAQQEFPQPLSDVQVEWRAHGAVLTGSISGRPVQVDARSAIVHEPLDLLYESLPLAQFDRQAQTFWRRVFWLVRIPGGKRLLGALARLSRKRS